MGRDSGEERARRHHLHGNRHRTPSPGHPSPRRSSGFDILGGPQPSARHTDEATAAEGEGHQQQPLAHRGSASPRRQHHHHHDHHRQETIKAVREMYFAKPAKAKDPVPRVSWKHDTDMDEPPASRQYVEYVDPLRFRGPGPASPRSLYPSPRSLYPRLGNTMHYRDHPRAYSDNMMKWVRTPGSGPPWVRPRSPVLADWKNEYGPGYRAYLPPGAISMAPGIYDARCDPTPSSPRSPQFGFAQQAPLDQVLYAVERQHGFSDGYPYGDTISRVETVYPAITSRPANAYGEWQQTMHVADRMENGLQRQARQQEIVNPSYQQATLPLSELGKSEAPPAGAGLLHAEEEEEEEEGSFKAKARNEVSAGTELRHERDYFDDCFRRQQKLSEDILKERELFTLKRENQKLQKHLRDMQLDLQSAISVPPKDPNIRMEELKKSQLHFKRKSEAIEIILKGQQRLVEQQRQIDDMHQRVSGARADDSLIDHVQTQIDRMQRQIHDMHQRIASDVRAERQSEDTHQRVYDPLAALEESAELLEQRGHSGADKLSKMLDDHEALQRALQEVGKRAAQTPGHERELQQLRERNRRLEEKLAAMLARQTHGVPESESKAAPANPAATKSQSANILKHQLDVMAKRVSDLGAIYSINEQSLGDGGTIYSSNEQGLSCRPVHRRMHIYAGRRECAACTVLVRLTACTTPQRRVLKKTQIRSIPLSTI
jgi:DNA polymerase III delta prime subunit